jgi:hypothetical protein
VTTSAASAPQLAASILPSSRSVEVQGTATAFAAIANGGTVPAAGVSIAPQDTLPGIFTYQTTDPATNLPTGTPNTPVTIPAGGFQTFVIAFRAAGPFGPADVTFNFGGSSGAAVAPILGLNTLLLSASNTPVPDVVALAATQGNTGIVNIPGVTGAGAFAVATVNVGAGGSIIVSADTGSGTAAVQAGQAVLPVTLTLCQTNPATGVCLGDPTPTVTTQINSGETPTFAVFVKGNGLVPFDPATNRVAVRFRDAGGAIRGATSVAVRTQ